MTEGQREEVRSLDACMLGGERAVEGGDESSRGGDLYSVDKSADWDLAKFRTDSRSRSARLAGRVQRQIWGERCMGPTTSDWPLSRETVAFPMRK